LSPGLIPLGSARGAQARWHQLRTHGLARPFCRSAGWRARAGCTALLAGGCASLMSSAASGLAADLQAAVQNQDDPETVRDGAPAYMLLLDSFIEGDPDDPKLLAAAANLYAAYGTVFAENPERAARLTERARDYASRAVCLSFAPGCDWPGMPFDEF